ncbi:hypothetical protein SDC9_191370 [bioreactor metagenome]|uniref:Uncharacterized protein n=1 Tax=bioreactor metagenome TaxID=1076179 RepID=A0A645I042_9ZZZZ
MFCAGIFAQQYGVYIVPVFRLTPLCAVNRDVHILCFVGLYLRRVVGYGKPKLAQRGHNGEILFFKVGIDSGKRSVVTDGATR